MTVVLKTNEGGLWTLPQAAELSRRGAEVTFIIPAGDGKLRRSLDETRHQVEDSPFDFSFRPSLSLIRGLWKFRRLLKATRPDVVFYHLYASALACRIASVGLATRRVHMVAGPLYLENPAIKIAERALCRLDSHLIAGSDFTARAYRQLGMPNRRLTSIPYGVDLEKYVRGPDNRVKLWGASDTTFVVIMVAYVYAPKRSVFPGVGIKGHDIALNVWSTFVSEFPDSILVLVGSGFDSAGEHHRNELMHSPTGRKPSVRWIESTGDVRPLYSSADLSISPSLSENHGAALEASSLSVPSIVSDAGGLPETVTALSGWVTPAGDKTQLLIALREARGRYLSGSLSGMGQAARSHIEEHFNVSESNRRIAEIVLDKSLEQSDRL